MIKKTFFYATINLSVIISECKIVFLFILICLYSNGCTTVERTNSGVAKNERIEEHNQQNIPQTLRIIISKGKNATIYFKKETTLTFVTSDDLKYTYPGKKLTLFEKGYDAILDDISYVSNVVSITSQDSIKFTLTNNLYEGKLYIYLDKDALVLLEISVLDYIKGVITGEMPKTFHSNYVMVHSIISYTYFIYKYLYYKNQGIEYTPNISELEQKYVYKENFYYGDILKKIFGYVITYKGRIFPPFYHSTCGGITDNAKETFEDNRWKDIKPLTGKVKCDYCVVSPYRKWYFVEDIQKFKKTFFVNCSKKLFILPLSKTSSGNISKIGLYCDNMLIKSVNIFAFRTKLGTNKLRSYRFTILEDNGKFIFEGNGFGHRVGLCQFGANGMLRSGYSYIDVLKYYFPDVDIVKLSDVWASISY